MPVPGPDSTTGCGYRWRRLPPYWSLKRYRDHPGQMGHIADYNDQIWTGLPGASTKGHPAPYPLALAERLIRMLSFVGDTVLDPFLGTGTTSIAATRWGRHSHGIELAPSTFEQARQRVSSEPSVVSGLATIELLRGA